MTSQIDHVELWLNRKAESPSTRNGYSKAWEKFRVFCIQTFDYNPNNIVLEWRKIQTSSRQRERRKALFQNQLKDIIESFRTYLKQETLDLSPLTRKYYLSIIRSFLKSWDIPVNIELPKRAFVKFHNRDITKEEIRQILEHTVDIRDRCFFIVMAESGQRPDTLTKLQYKHIRRDFERRVIPMQILLPSSLLKYHVPDRFAFVGEEGFKVLSEYVRLYLPLDDDDYIFKPLRGDKTIRSTTTAFSMSFNRLVHKLKLDKSRGRAKPKSLRLYCLRKYFRNNMRGVDSGYINFWMGHAQDSDMHYISVDPKRHREEYIRGYPHLRISKPEVNEDIQELKSDLTQYKSAFGLLQKQLEHREKEIQELRTKIEKMETPEWVEDLLRRIPPEELRKVLKSVAKDIK